MSSSQQKPKTKKQLNQEALTASLEYRWEEAIALNDEILDRFPRDAEALNRKGRAYMEMGQLAMEKLLDLKNGKAVPDPIFTGLDVCTQENAESCLQK